MHRSQQDLSPPSSSLAGPSWQWAVILTLCALDLAVTPVVSSHHPVPGESKTTVDTVEALAKSQQPQAIDLGPVPDWARKRTDTAYGSGSQAVSGEFKTTVDAAEALAVGTKSLRTQAFGVGLATTLLVPDGARELTDVFSPVTGSLKTTVDAWYDDKAGTEAIYEPIADWDTSGVTSCKEAFKDRGEFNEDISRWNMAGVTDMTDMFKSATSFNGDVSAWNVQAVTKARDVPICQLLQRGRICLERAVCHEHAFHVRRCPFFQRGRFCLERAVCHDHALDVLQRIYLQRGRVCLERAGCHEHERDVQKCRILQRGPLPLEARLYGLGDHHG